MILDSKMTYGYVAKLNINKQVGPTKLVGLFTSGFRNHSSF